MCKNHNPRVIDKCMRAYIENLNLFMRKEYKILNCCCGHGKYPPTIVFRAVDPFTFFRYYDLVSGVEIPRTKRFYTKDKEGYYYIKEVIERKHE